MRKQAKAVISLLALVCGGCASDGLSPREDSTNNLSATVYPQQQRRAGENSQTATEPAAAIKLTVAPAQPIAVPIRVGVVQTGDVAPPQAMLDSFRRRKDLFGLVEPLPGNVPLLTLRNTAAGMGLNYLLVYGGSVDRSTAPTSLELFNLTIIGLFIVPSEQITANGKATGSLIDVSTGQIAMSVSVDARGSAFLPTYVAENSSEALTGGVRDELISKMTAQTIDRLGDGREKSAAVATSPGK